MGSLWTVAVCGKVERVVAAATAFAEASNSEDEFLRSPSTNRSAPPFLLECPLQQGCECVPCRARRSHGRARSDGHMRRHFERTLLHRQSHHPRRVLVVVGDGGDNASTTTFEHVLREAQASNAAIYTVGIIDPLEREANPGLLKRLAQATGGEAFFPRHVDDVDDVLQTIADDIRHSYTWLCLVQFSARRAVSSTRVVVNDPPVDHCGSARVTVIAPLAPGEMRSYARESN